MRSTTFAILSFIAFQSYNNASVIQLAQTDEIHGEYRGLHENITCNRTVKATASDEILKEASLTSSQWASLSRPTGPDDAKWTCTVCFEGFRAISGTGHFTGVVNLAILFSEVPCDLSEWSLDNVAFVNVSYEGFLYDVNATPNSRTKFIPQCIVADDDSSRTVSLLPRLNQNSNMKILDFQRCDRKSISQRNLENIFHWGNYVGLIFTHNEFLVDIEVPEGGEDAFEAMISKASWQIIRDVPKIDCCRVEPVFQKTLKHDSTLQKDLCYNNQRQELLTHDNFVNRTVLDYINDCPAWPEPDSKWVIVYPGTLSQVSTAADLLKNEMAKLFDKLNWKVAAEFFRDMSSKDAIYFFFAGVPVVVLLLCCFCYCLCCNAKAGDKNSVQVFSM